MIDPQIQSKIRRLIDIHGGLVPRGVLEQLNLLGAMATVVKFETGVEPVHLSFAGRDLPVMALWMMGGRCVTVTVEPDTHRYWVICAPVRRSDGSVATGTSVQVTGEDVPALVDWIVDNTAEIVTDKEMV